MLLSVRLVAATGALRRGSEVEEHAVDEVVLITHGRGLASVGADTMPVQSGSIMYTPLGMRHGFINDTTETLEYVVVYGPFAAARDLVPHSAAWPRNRALHVLRKSREAAPNLGHSDIS